MTNKTRKRILTAMYELDTFSAEELREALSNTSHISSFRNAYFFDNSVMRFVRRFHESGRVKRLGRGLYKLTARGRKNIEQAFNS